MKKIINQINESFSCSFKNKRIDSLQSLYFLVHGLENFLLDFNEKLDPFFINPDKIEPIYFKALLNPKNNITFDWKNIINSLYSKEGFLYKNSTESITTKFFTSLVDRKVLDFINLYCFYHKKSKFISWYLIQDLIEIIKTIRALDSINELEERENKFYIYSIFTLLNEYLIFQEDFFNGILLFFPKLLDQNKLQEFLKYNKDFIKPLIKKINDITAKKVNLSSEQKDFKCILSILADKEEQTLYEEIAVEIEASIAILWTWFGLVDIACDHLLDDVLAYNFAKLAKINPRSLRSTYLLKV